MFTIFIMHTSFQLWHCVFPVSYLRGVRYPTETETAGPTSSGTAGTAETTVSGTGVSYAALAHMTLPMSPSEPHGSMSLLRWYFIYKVGRVGLGT